MIKKAFSVIFLTILMINMPFLRGGWIGRELFNCFLSGNISALLVQPIENTTRNLFSQSTSGTNQFIKNYVPLLISGSTALIASRVASSYGYNHWIIESLAKAVILSKLNQLIMPSIISKFHQLIMPSIHRQKINRSNVGSKLFLIDNDYPYIARFLNDGVTYGERQEYKNTLSLSAQVLHRWGLSEEAIISIDTNLKKHTTEFLVSSLITIFVFGPLAEKMIHQKTSA